MQFSNILVIIQRSNGDVLLSASLIKQISSYFNPKSIDLLVNDDTLAVAKSIPNIKKIFTFSYKDKRENRWKQEKNIFKNIYRKYDLSINLTASDRSVLYALIASKYSISAIEGFKYKSWWKSLLLTHSYTFDIKKHILLNNLEPLKLLGCKQINKQLAPQSSESSAATITRRLQKLKIKNFIIFHPSAQYSYKTYPALSRNELLRLLNELGVPIIVTGGNSDIDILIKKNLPKLENIFNWIGKTSIDEYISLSQFSDAYIGMDTLNMHIAASQNKRIFSIFGPTILSMWSPWSNELETSAIKNTPKQTYGNITIFQASMPCVACGMAGCGNNYRSECLYRIKPSDIFEEIHTWQKTLRLKF